MHEEKTLLHMQNIIKTFPGVKALKGVDFSVKEGEIMGLMGENGAGKSCLIKILTGIYTKDLGTITFDGQEINPVSSLQAQNYGISTIYQELNLIPYLSIAENIFLARELKTRSGLVDWKREYAEAEELLGNMGINIDVKKPLNSFSTAIQQLTAIAKAISVNAKLIVMDEPTSSLDDNEVKVIFDQVRELKKKNVSIIFVSHRMDEVFEICERVTVLRDGELIGVRDAASLGKMQLIEMMVGRDLSHKQARKPKNPAIDDEESYVVEAEGITTPKLKGVDFNIKKGEIVGLSGLLGSGRTEMARVLFGADSMKEGTIKVNGESVRFKLPQNAIKKKIAMCPEDRKIDGIIPNMSVRENISMIILPKLIKNGFVDKKRQTEIVNEYISRLRIKTPDDKQKVKFLSGGNQQKVILARWLCSQPDFIILDEPTRGIDVGAKAEIEELMQEFASEGISVMMISSEIEEVVRNSDRVVVMREGVKVGEIAYDDVSAINIMSSIAHGKPADKNAVDVVEVNS